MTPTTSGAAPASGRFTRTTAPPESPPAPPAVIPQALAIWAPEPPTWGQRMIPKGIRSAMADLGLWQEPRPLKPSFHLTQVIEVLTRYGWCQSFDFSPTGRMCIRGAQTFLESTGHVTAIDRGKAVNYLQTQLSRQGVTMRFWEWNDLPNNTFRGVEATISAASDMARKSGD
ncbi:hypothetical protein OG333_37570 (plasmid) [Streptomyces anulatus]|uniref:DUF6197 family protein n=1 Tax=Streptomyces anulatus TaxID=1892 RepID=UPI002F915D5B|nr:hypothetical protein OG333_37570 [Streptomyces anulatus]